MVWRGVKFLVFIFIFVMIFALICCFNEQGRGGREGRGDRLFKIIYLPLSFSFFFSFVKILGWKGEA